MTAVDCVHGTCVWCTDARRVSAVTLDWSESTGGLQHCRHCGERGGWSRFWN